MSKGTKGVPEAKLLFAKKADQLMRGLILETASRLTVKTPVDQGTARGNWFTDFKQAPPGGTENKSKSGQKSISAASGFAAKIVGKALDKTVWITNGLPYIQRLDNGWSQQRPEGMVAVTVAELGPLTQEIAKRIAISQKVTATFAAKGGTDGQ